MYGSGALDVLEVGVREEYAGINGVPHEWLLHFKKRCEIIKSSLVNSEVNNNQNS